MLHAPLLAQLRDRRIDSWKLRPFEDYELKVFLGSFPQIGNPGPLGLYAFGLTTAFLQVRIGAEKSL